MPQLRHGAAGAPSNEKGHLVYIVGPREGGQRRLIGYACRKALGRTRAIFPRRYISGPIDTDREEFHPLTTAAFEDWLRRGFFALSWTDDRCQYGIGREIDAWMEAGLNVVITASVEFLPDARNKYPNLQVVLVSPGVDALVDRLRRQIGLDEDAIREQAEQAALLETTFGTGPVVRTDQSWEAAGRALVNILAGSPVRAVA